MFFKDAYIYTKAYSYCFSFSKILIHSRARGKQSLIKQFSKTIQRETFQCVKDLF